MFTISLLLLSPGTLLPSTFADAPASAADALALQTAAAAAGAADTYKALLSMRTIYGALLAYLQGSFSTQDTLLGACKGRPPPPVWSAQVGEERASPTRQQK